jgi:hypothetical protein
MGRFARNQRADSASWGGHSGHGSETLKLGHEQREQAVSVCSEKECQQNGQIMTLIVTPLMTL